MNLSRVPVCPSCVESLRPLDEPVCAVCGQHRLPATADERTCLDCAGREFPYLRAVAYGSYDGALRELIHLMKYQRVGPSARVLGRCLAEAITKVAPEFGAEPPTVVIVPLHASKLRQRGFNQSELIARAALKHLRVTSGDGSAAPSVLARLAIRRSVLVRHRATGSQTGLSRAQRKLNLRGAFAVTRPNEVAGRDILLIDDVFTTGTTAAECARMLRRARAGRIWVATVATVLRAETHESFGSAQEQREIAAAVRAGGF